MAIRNLCLRSVPGREKPCQSDLKIDGEERLHVVMGLTAAGIRKGIARHGALVLASRYEPWGLVIAESFAAGLPVICTEACGASVELVRSYYNGLTVATGDAEALADAMRWVHEHDDRLPEMGRNGCHFAAAFSTQVWAERWVNMFRDLLP